MRISRLRSPSYILGTHLSQSCSSLGSNVSTGWTLRVWGSWQDLPTPEQDGDFYGDSEAAEPFIFCHCHELLQSWHLSWSWVSKGTSQRVIMVPQNHISSFFIYKKIIKNTQSLLSPGGLLEAAVLGVSNSSSSVANWNLNEGVVLKETGTINLVGL